MSIYITFVISIVKVLLEPYYLNRWWINKQPTCHQEGNNDEKHNETEGEEIINICQLNRKYKSYNKPNLIEPYS